MKNKKLFIILFTFLLTLVPTIAMAADIKPPAHAVNGFLAVIPLIVIIVLLFLKVHMIVAGLTGGVIAMIMGGISLATANQFMLESIPTMLTITVPIINSAIAMAVFKSGSYVTALTLVRRGIKGHAEYFAAFIIILQAAATYMSGVGGGSAMVIAPLAFAAMGAIPELIAGMAIAAAVSFTTSPASLETSIAAKLGGFEIQDYVSTMRPFWLFFVAIAIALAFWGAKRRKAIFISDEDVEVTKMSNAALWKTTLPAIFLLFAVIAGPTINKAVGMPLLGPLVYTIVTGALIFLCTKMTMNQSFEAIVDGSSYILTRLFGVGIFLAFINMVGDIGAFQAIAGIAEDVPTAIMVPTAVLAGFLIGVPAGAYVGSILAMVLPVAIALSFNTISIGFVVMGVGFGAMMSFVNITMQALSSGFQIPIIDVVKGNAKWIVSCLVLLMAASFIFA